MGVLFGTALQSIPWGLVEWAVAHPELGWVLLFIWLFVELRTRKGRIYQLDQKITGSIIVIRALAQQEDAIDEDRVDAYLAENGMSPEDFIKHDEGDNNQSTFTSDD